MHTLTHCSNGDKINSITDHATSLIWEAGECIFEGMVGLELDCSVILAVLYRVCVIENVQTHMILRYMYTIVFLELKLIALHMFLDNNHGIVPSVYSV